MKTIKLACILICIGLTISCSSIIPVKYDIYGVKYDYDKQTDFAQLKTFDWMPVPDGENMDDFLMVLIKEAVNAELRIKGLKLTSESPDFLIAHHTATKDMVEVIEWGYDYGPYGRYWGGDWGPRNVSTYDYEEGSLILDFVDAKSKKLIWRGTAKAEVQNVDSSEYREQLINKTVKKILEKYPPSSK